VVARPIRGDPYRASANGHLRKIHIETGVVSANGPGPEGNGIEAALLEGVPDLVGDERIPGLPPQLRISSDKE
jgi:hypothetical protein